MIRHFTNRLKSSFRRQRSAQHDGSTDWPTPSQDSFRQSQSGLVVHGLHKSATMFLYKFFDELCEALDIPLYSIHKPAPYRELSGDAPDEAFVLCPIRSFDAPPLDSLTQPPEQRIHRLFQIRDPRDLLVSEYFSVGWRHTTEGWSEEELQRREQIRALSLDEYVIAEPDISKYPLLGRYQPLLTRLREGKHDDETTVAKYETMVTEFSTWLQVVLRTIQIDSAFAANRAFVRFIESRYRHEFVVDPSEHGHRRNVTPGDHREKLLPATIEELNRRFEAVLSTFNYQR